MRWVTQWLILGFRIRKNELHTIVVALQRLRRGGMPRIIVCSGVFRNQPKDVRHRDLVVQDMQRLKIHTVFIRSR